MVALATTRPVIPWAMVVTAPAAAAPMAVTIFVCSHPKASWGLGTSFPRHEHQDICCHPPASLGQASTTGPHRPRVFSKAQGADLGLALAEARTAERRCSQVGQLDRLYHPTVNVLEGDLEALHRSPDSSVYAAANAIAADAAAVAIAAVSGLFSAPRHSVGGLGQGRACMAPQVEGERTTASQTIPPSTAAQIHCRPRPPRQEVRRAQSVISVARDACQPPQLGQKSSIGPPQVGLQHIGQPEGSAASPAGSAPPP